MGTFMTQPKPWELAWLIWLEVQVYPYRWSIRSKKVFDRAMSYSRQASLRGLVQQ